MKLKLDLEKISIGQISVNHDDCNYLFYLKIVLIIPVSRQSDLDADWPLSVNDLMPQSALLSSSPCGLLAWVDSLSALSAQVFILDNWSQGSHCRPAAFLWFTCLPGQPVCSPDTGLSCFSELSLPIRFACLRGQPVCSPDTGLSCSSELPLQILSVSTSYQCSAMLCVPSSRCLTCWTLWLIR